MPGFSRVAYPASLEHPRPRRPQRYVGGAARTQSARYAETIADRVDISARDMPQLGRRVVAEAIGTALLLVAIVGYGYHMGERLMAVT